jgi:hypothetical protein
VLKEDQKMNQGQDDRSRKPRAIAIAAASGQDKRVTVVAKALLTAAGVATLLQAVWAMHNMMLAVQP